MVSTVSSQGLAFACVSMCECSPGAPASSHNAKRCDFELFVSVLRNASDLFRLYPAFLSMSAGIGSSPSDSQSIKQYR